MSAVTPSMLMYSLQFGDASKFQTELDSAIHSVQLQESELHSLHLQLRELEQQLDERDAHRVEGDAHGAWA